MIGVLIGFAIIAFVVAIGYGLGRSGLLGPDAAHVLGRLGFFVLSPALLFTVLAEADVTALFSELLPTTASVAALTLVLFALVALVFWRREVPEATIGSLGSAYANATNMGIPLSAYVLFASGTDPIVGLRSPGTRRIARGDAITSAVGYWGGLCARAGMVTDDDQVFLDQFAIPYFRGVVTWYETMAVGVAGGEIRERVVAALAAGGLAPALNPGHLTGYDEWVHSPIYPGSTDRIASGMPFQCDIIPVPMPPGRAVNCEDPVVFADAALRAELRERFPATWERIAARQAFMREQLGIAISDDLLPLSTTPAYLAPLWLAPSKVLTVG